MEQIIKQITNQYNGNGYLEIHVQEREFTSIEYSGQELETLTRSNVYIGNIRIFEEGFWYFISFMDRDLKPHFETIKEMIKSGEGKQGGIKPYKQINDKISTSFKINPDDISLEEKNNLIKSYNGLILNSKNIQTSRAAYKDYKKTKYFGNTEGSYIEQQKVFSGFSCVAIARDGRNVQRASFSNAGFGGFELVQGYENDIDGLVKEVNEMLYAPQVKGGRYKVVLDNQMSGVFAHEAFGHLSEADFIYENKDMQEMMKLGRVFGSDIVNIVDDGSIKGLAGYTPYDDEGVTAMRNELIKNGKLNKRLTSRETAYKLDEPLSGNARALSPYFSPQVRMTNTFIDQGKSTVDEIISSCEDGIYTKGFIGGMTSLEQFTFTPRCAYMIKNGKIAGPVKDVVLSGNVFETIGNIKMVGNDLQYFGTLGGCGKGGQNGLPVTTGGPHILIEDVLVGGN